MILNIQVSTSAAAGEQQGLSEPLKNGAREHFSPTAIGSDLLPVKEGTEDGSVFNVTYFEDTEKSADKENENTKLCVNTTPDEVVLEVNLNNQAKN